MTPQALDAEMRALHPDGDPARRAALHEAAAELAEDPAARRFELTHAWVHALVAGEQARVANLETALRRLGGL